MEGTSNSYVPRSKRNEFSLTYSSNYWRWMLLLFPFYNKEIDVWQIFQGSSAKTHSGAHDSNGSAPAPPSPKDPESVSWMSCNGKAFLFWAEATSSPVPSLHPLRLEKVSSSTMSGVFQSSNRLALFPFGCPDPSKHTLQHYVRAGR